MIYPFISHLLTGFLSSICIFIDLLFHSLCNLVVPSFLYFYEVNSFNHCTGEDIHY